LSKHRVAIIGLGLAAPPHVQSLVELGDRVEVVWAVSRTQERLRELAGKIPFPTTIELERVLRDRSIRSAIVLTPPNTHLELVERLAAEGKHVLLEKPLEIDLAKASALVKACAARGITLGVVFQHRFRPAALALHDLVASGALGELASATVAVRWWRPQSYYDDPGRGTYARDGGGVLMTQAIHALDLYLSLTGEPMEVSASVTTTALHRMEGEDLAAAVLHFQGGAIGLVDATTASYPGFPERIELVGTRATAVYSGGRLDVYYQDGRQDGVGTTEAFGAGASHMAFSHLAHKALLADFLDAVDEGREPRSSGHSALRVHRLIDAAVASARQGKPVRLSSGGEK
jgi:UDP-N-acetyl-2-amino-2-deoxyglucuronate dehydrogenase